MKVILKNLSKYYAKWGVKRFFSYNSVKLKKMSTIFVFCLLCVFLVPKIESFHPKKIVDSIQDAVLSFGFGGGFPIEANGNKVDCKNFKTFGRDLIMVSDTSFICFNTNAKKIFDRPHGFTRPILKCSKNRALIYDLSGSSFKIESRNKSILASSFLENIICGNISDNGNYVFATESKDYLSDLMVFSEDSKEIFKHCFSDCFLNNVSLSKDGKLVAVSGLLAQEGALKSLIYVFDAEFGKLKTKVEYQDVLFLDLAFLNNSNVVAIGDNLTSVIRVFQNKQESYQYDQRPLTAFDINPQNGAVLSLSTRADFAQCDIVSINGDGKNQTITQTELNATALSYNNNGTIALLGGEKLNVYSKYGKNIYSSSFETNVKTIDMRSSRSMYILESNRASVLDFA
ncbi:MAG: DUF5711 family protein [Oscillospiraceae bacterium]|jgi:hypothetical protein|nr:DUF5711 family protein [Oscillospiraceae bacterium]